MVKTFYTGSFSKDICEQHGRLSKEKVLKLINIEGIEVRNSFDHSVDKQMSYQRKTTIKPSGSEIKHSIIIPTFTDDSDLEQAIKIAHELGHYYDLNKEHKFKSSFISVEFKLTTYIGEVMAWHKAKKILEDENIIRQNGNEQEREAFQEFVRVKRESLQTYGNPLTFYSKSITNASFRLLKLFISSYVLVALLFLLKNNEIPVPLFQESYNLKIDFFYSYVFDVFSFILTIKIILWVAFFSMKNIYKGMS